MFREKYNGGNNKKTKRDNKAKTDATGTNIHVPPTLHLSKYTPTSTKQIQKEAASRQQDDMKTRGYSPGRKAHEKIIKDVSDIHTKNKNYSVMSTKNGRVILKKQNPRSIQMNKKP